MRSRLKVAGHFLAGHELRSLERITVLEILQHRSGQLMCLLRAAIIYVNFRVQLLLEGF